MRDNQKWFQDSCEFLIASVEKAANEALRTAASNDDKVLIHEAASNFERLFWWVADGSGGNVAAIGVLAAAIDIFSRAPPTREELVRTIMRETMRGFGQKGGRPPGNPTIELTKLIASNPTMPWRPAANRVGLSKNAAAKKRIERVRKSQKK